MTWLSNGVNPFGVGGQGLASYYAPDIFQWLFGGSGGPNVLVYSNNTSPLTFVAVSIPLSVVNGLVWSSDLRRWVAVGQGGQLFYYSSDGIGWSAATNANTVFSIGYDVTYVPRQSVFIAVGQGGSATIGFSSDGQVWAAIASSTQIFTNFADHVCTSWASNLILAVGSGTNNTVARSATNYTNFQALGPSVFNQTQVATSCAYGAGGMFILSGNSSITSLVAGYQTIGASTFTTTGNLYATRYTNTFGTGMLNFVVVYVSAGSGTATVALYTDSNRGYPGTLIASSGSVTVTPLGLATSFSLSPAVTTVPSGSFWIVWTQTGTLARARDAVSGSVTVFYPFAYGTAFPVTWPTTGLTTTNDAFTMYVNFANFGDLAYTFDGINYNSVLGSWNLFTGQANDIAYNPNVGIWVAGGTSTNPSIAYSGQGSSQWTLGNCSGFTCPASVTTIAAFTTSAMSPTSKQGVYALSGVMPIAPTANTLDFLIGGTSGTAGTGVGLGYTLDNTNVFSFTPQSTAGTIFNGPCTAMTYAPELGIWLVTIQTAANNWQNLYSASPFTGWTVINSGLTINSQVTSFTWSSTQQIFLATLLATTNNCFWSRTGVTWTVSTCATVLTVSVRAAAYSRQQNLWVAVGQGAANNIAYTSSLTGTWTGVGGLTMTSCRTVTFAPSIPLWVIGGASSGTTSLLVTINPTIQTPVAPSNQPFGTTSAIANGCYFGNGLFVCVGTPGTGSTGTIAWSSTGTTWTGLGTSIFSTAGFGVFYDIGNALWLAAGQGTNQVARSVDGKTWTAIATNPFASAATVVYAPVTVANSLTREMVLLVDEYKREKGNITTAMI